MRRFGDVTSETSRSKSPQGMSSLFPGSWFEKFENFDREFDDFRKKSLKDLNIKHSV